jgi:hypothetical protein
VQRNAYFLQLSKNFSRFPALGISAPGGAQCRFGAATACTNKKPGVERRACPSTRLGRFLPAQPPERICSKLVCLIPGVRNQPHLNLWPVPVRQRTPQRSEALPTSIQYTYFSVPVKLHSTNFHHRLAQAPCAFLLNCGKRAIPHPLLASPFSSREPTSSSPAAQCRSSANTPPSVHSDSANAPAHQSTSPREYPSHARSAIQFVRSRFSR